MRRKWIRLYRIFFSVPTVIVFIFFLLLMSTATTSNGEPITTGEWLLLSVIIYVIILFPINLIIRLIERLILKIPFSELLGRPLFHLFSKDEDFSIYDKSLLECLKEAKEGFSVKVLWADILYFIDSILFPPAKVMFVIWTICWVTSCISNKNIPKLGELVVVFVGYFIYCGLADLIYFAFQKKYYAYQIKIANRHMKRLKALMDEIDPDYFTEHFTEDFKRKEDLNRTVAKDNFVLGEDVYFEDAAHLAVERGQLSIGALQRQFKVQFNRAARIMDELEQAGIVGPEEGTRPRRVLIDEDMLVYMLSKKKQQSITETNTYNGNVSEIDRIELYNNNYDYMTGVDFELFCADLLRKLGFVNVETTKASGDQGIDVLAMRDGVKYGIQCKCYSQDINNKAVQEAFAGAKFYDCHVAVVMTNRYFTKSARELAEKNNILLWDRDELNRLIEEKDKNLFSGGTNDIKGLY